MMKQLTNANDISNHFDFLFFDAQDKPISSQISALVWIEQVLPNMTAKKGMYLEPRNLMGNTPIPFSKNHGEKMDIEIHFLVDEPRFIRIEDLPLNPTFYNIQELFTIAAQRAGGDIVPPDSTTGFIRHAFKGQKEESTYRVIQTGNHFDVKQLKNNGEQDYWEPMSLKSPRTKGIVKLFKEQLANDTLQTTL